MATKQKLVNNMNYLINKLAKMAYKKNEYTCADFDNLYIEMEKNMMELESKIIKIKKD